MAELDTEHGVRTGRQQVGHFHARRRRERTQDPSKGLFGTNAFPLNTTTIADAFDVSAPVTLAATIRITGASPVGLVWEIGDAAHGAACWLEAGQIGVVFGGLTGADQSLLLYPVTFGVGQRFRIVASCIPASGDGRLWIERNEIPVAKDQAGTAFPTDQWAVASPDGSVGQAPNGTVNTTVPVGSRVAPSDFAVISPLDHFRNQFPRHFIA